MIRLSAQQCITACSFHHLGPEAVCNCPQPGAAHSCLQLGAECSCPQLGAACSCLQPGAACCCPALSKSCSSLAHTPVLVAQQLRQQSHQSLECRQLGLACHQMHSLTPLLMLHHLMIPCPAQSQKLLVTQQADVLS